MGRGTFTRELFTAAREKHTTVGESATFRGEQEVRKTGKLNPLVDPAEYGVVRESRIRLEERSDGRFEVSVGTPATIEYRLDTTGSMGDNVDRALKALPQICGLTSAVLPSRDPFFCASIFGDVGDRFVLCRGQFEVLAERMVDQLTLMHPEGGGGDDPEDPHYGLFGAAYLTNAYLHRIGLRSFDFLITDAPCHDHMDVRQLKRIFGEEVLEKAIENGHQIDPRNLPSNREIVADLQKRAHAFCLLVARRTNSSTREYWQAIYGDEHIIDLPEIELLPHVMAAIIGLTEGTLDLRSAADFLVEQNLTKNQADGVVAAVAHIPLGAQCVLPNFGRMPKQGDIFLNKTDLWPVNPEDLPAVDSADEESDTLEPSGGWL